MSTSLESWLSNHFR